MNKDTKIVGLSLFANVGIAEALLSEIGVEIKVANEIDEKRAQFYRALYPNAEMICGDITDQNIMAQIVKESKKKMVNFVMATPPCQGMSEAGKRDAFDERNQLISYTIDIIKLLRPKYVLIENVPTLLKTKIVIDGEVVTIPDYVTRELGELYTINENTLLKAMDVGVPQMRKRNFFLMVRKDLKLKWNLPRKEKEITLEDAIGHLPSVDPLLREGLEFTLKKFPDFEAKRSRALKVSKWHSPPVHSWKQVEWLMHTPSGKSAIYNEKYFPQKEDGSRVKAHHNNYRRMNWCKPSRTITQNNGVMSSLCCVHPGREYVAGKKKLYSDPRVLTIYEILIVSSLPCDINIPEWAEDSFIRKVIGEGVPPLMIKKIMVELLNLLGK